MSGLGFIKRGPNQLKKKKTVWFNKVKAKVCAIF